MSLCYLNVYIHKASILLKILYSSGEGRGEGEMREQREGEEGEEGKEATLAQKFEKIKSCRYIRHYRPDGTAVEEPFQLLH